MNQCKDQNSAQIQKVEENMKYSAKIKYKRPFIEVEVQDRQGNGILKSSIKITAVQDMFIHFYRRLSSLKPQGQNCYNFQQ